MFESTYIYVYVMHELCSASLRLCCAGYQESWGVSRYRSKGLPRGAYMWILARWTFVALLAAHASSGVAHDEHGAPQSMHSAGALSTPGLCAMATSAHGCLHLAQLPCALCTIGIHICIRFFHMTSSTGQTIRVADESHIGLASGQCRLLIQLRLAPYHRRKLACHIRLTWHLQS